MPQRNMPQNFFRLTWINWLFCLASRIASLVKRGWSSILRNENNSEAEGGARNKELEALKTEREEWAKRYDGIQREFQAVEKESQTIRKEKDDLERDIKNLAKQKMETDERYRRLEQTSREKSASQARQLEELRGSIEAKDRTLAELMRQCDGLRKRDEDTAILLHARTTELKAAQAFLTKANVFSGTEITQMVADLNTDIYQTAAALADCVDWKMHPNGHLQEAELAILALDIGEVLTQALVSMDDSYIAQIVFQNILSLYLKGIVCSCTLDFSQESEIVNRVYNQIYSSIRQQEPQAVAGRWRALTWDHLRRLNGGDSAIQSPLLSFISDRLMRVFRVSGHATDGEVLQRIKKKFVDNLKDMVELALRLNKAIGYETTSCDFEIILPTCGQMFDPSIMEDTDGEDIEAGSHLSDSIWILCTTELGLRRTEKKNTKGKEQAWQTVLLLKPKVALASIIQDTLSNTGKVGSMAMQNALG